MSGLRAWFNEAPLWKYVLVQSVISLVTLILVAEAIFWMSQGHFDRPSPLFFVIWLAFMTPLYVWQGKKRAASPIAKPEA